METFDLIVIGGGAGGLVAASGASAFGAKTALVHKGPLGGDCLWTGCVPTKSLLHIANLIHTSKKAAPYGVTQASPVSLRSVRKKVEESIKRIQLHDDPSRFRKMGIHLHEGSAKFMGPHQVEVNGADCLYAKKIIIATGSSPRIPPIEGLHQIGYVTNESFLKMDELPKRWLVMGAGAVGLEFAQILLRFGCEVTVVEQSEMVLAYRDREMVLALKEALEREGIRFLTGRSVLRVDRVQQGIQVWLDQNGDSKTLMVDLIFIASGRTPYTEGLELDVAGVQTAQGAILVNERMQTNLPHIYAVGDVVGKRGYTHAAGWEAKQAVSHALFGLSQKIKDEEIPAVIYTDPEFFCLGLTEQEATQRYGTVHIYRTPLNQVDRFITEGEHQGWVKIITDKRGRILGAHAVGRGMGDFMQEVAFAKRFGHRIGDLSQVIHPYPTHVEAIQKTADLYWREKLFSGTLGKWLKAYVRWFG